MLLPRRTAFRKYHRGRRRGTSRGQIAVQYGGTATSRAQHEYIYDVSAPDMKDPAGVGTIHKDAWQKNLDILVQLGLLKTAPKVDDLVDDSIMKEVLSGGKAVFP